MTTVNEQLATIKLLSTHETAMADLYWAYTERFPDRADLFRQLALAERDHAQLITDFGAAVEQGAAHADPRRFRPAAFQTSLDFIQEQLRQARRPELPLITALSVARDMEEALIERRCFEALEGDSAELQALLDRLAADTAEHRALLQQAWEQERRRG